MNNLNFRRVLKQPTLRMQYGGVAPGVEHDQGGAMDLKMAAQLPTVSQDATRPMNDTELATQAAGRAQGKSMAASMPMGGSQTQVTMPGLTPTHDYASLREGGEIHASGGGIFDRIFQSQSAWQRRQAQRELDAKNARATETQRINGLAGQERARFQQQPMRQVQNELDAENARGLETQRTNGLANAERQRFQQRAYAADHDGASMPAPAQPTQAPARTPAQAAPPAQTPAQVPDNNQVKLQTPAQATASFRANNPNVIANQTLSPGAPKLPAAPAAPAAQASPTGTPTSQLRPNAFGDNTSFNSSFNPTQATHGTTTMQEWSAPGRSNGQPNAQNMQAADNFAARDQAAHARLFPGPQIKQALDNAPTPNTGVPTGQFQVPRLREGGEIHAEWGFSNPFAAKTEAQKSAETRARYAAQDAAAAAKAAQQPVPAPQATQVAPSVAAGRDGAGGNSLTNREIQAGTLLKKHGGQTLRTGHGGDVPGHGKGDKIPAKYEPGEFVVSNDMLDAQPELREHLRGLRESVLAEKGMTPEMADAKALGQKPGSLRADGGFYEVGSDGVIRSPQQFGAPAVIPEAAPSGAADRVRNPEAAGRYLGERFKNFVSSAPVQAVAKGVALAGGLYNGSQAADAIDSGNVAGAIDSGALTAASLAGYGPGILGGTAAGAAGLSYMGGHMVGDQIYKRMGEDTKDSIGGSINGLVRKAGSALGQDWGVDDTAMRTLRGQPLSHGVNAGAPKPAAAAQHAPAERNIEAENAEKLAAGGFDLARHNAPGEIGQKRNTDREGNMLPEGQAQVWTGPKMGWQGGVSSDAEIAKRALRGEQYDQRLKEDYDRATTGPLGWKTQADALAVREQAAADAQERASIIPVGNFGHNASQRAYDTRAALRAQTETSRAQTAASLRATQMNNDTSLRNTDANNMVSLRNAKATNALGVYNAQREQGNKNREYEAGRSDAQFAQRETADKDLTSKLESMFTTKDDKGNAIVNKDAVGSTKAAVNAHLSGLIAAAQKRGDHATAAELRAKGTSAMGEDGLQRLLTQLEAQRRAAGAHSSANPWGGKYIDSSNPSDYDIVGVDEGVLQNQYRLRGGSRVPTRVLDNTQGGNAFLPDFVGNTRTTRFDSIKTK